MSENLVINIEIGDQLTTISCGHVIVELIKFLAYQRFQIPYTYQWLKQVINKKKDSENDSDTFQSKRHFHIASTALSNLDFVLKSLSKEIEGASQPQEICIAFGSSLISCKEIYRVILPIPCHKPQCHSIHIASDKKIQSNLFRNLVTSEKLSEVIFKALSPTNMYVLVKKLPTINVQVHCNDSFELVNGFRIPRSCKVVVLNLSTNLDNVTCCNDFKIFDEILSCDYSKLSVDDCNEKNYKNFQVIETTDKVKWFQSTYIIKGFKDCIVNGISVTNTWCN